MNILTMHHILNEYTIFTPYSQNTSRKLCREYLLKAIMRKELKVLNPNKPPRTNYFISEKDFNNWMKEFRPDLYAINILKEQQELEPIIFL